MQHALVYYGPLDENFGGLRSDTKSYRLASGKSGAVKEVSVDGLVVAVMQDGARFCAVMVNGVRLDVPVQLEPGLHTGPGEGSTGAWFGPSQVTYVDEDEPILKLVEHVREKNARPSVRRALDAVVQAVFQPDATPWPPDEPTANPMELDTRVRKILDTGVPAKPPPGLAAPRRVLQAGSFGYERSPAVKAWVLSQAKGKCESCGAAAPFVTANGEPFLEVHHVTPLAVAGPDTVDNAVAICPNCHRALHHAADATERTDTLRKSLRRLR